MLSCGALLAWALGRHFGVIVLHNFFRSFGTLVRVSASYVGCFTTSITSAEVRPLVLGGHIFHHLDELFVCAVSCLQGFGGVGRIYPRRLPAHPAA